MVPEISALILAAGESKRMGQPKLLLPWGRTSVLGAVIETFQRAGIEEILVVTGGAREQIEAVCATYGVRTTYNQDFATGGMLGSIKAGLRAQLPQRGAALIGLSDQPQVREETIRAVCTAHAETGRPLVVPSTRNRRGHPWLAARPIWQEILALPTSVTPRQFLAEHAAEIEYVEADESILLDLDTPEEYARQRP